MPCGSNSPGEITAWPGILSSTMTSTSSGQSLHAPLPVILMCRVSPNSLWKPDIALFNKQDLSNGILAADPKSSSTNVQLFSNGNILWIVPVFHRILCEGITYSNWPWGTQMCNLSFGSWSYDSSNYQLQFYDDLVIPLHRRTTLCNLL